MNNIFSAIQQFFINVVTTITTVILVISPFDKPQLQPTQTPTPVQEVQEATPSATPETAVKGINTKENKVNPTPKPETPKPTSSSTLAPETKRSYTTPPQTYQM